MHFLSPQYEIIQPNEFFNLVAKVTKTGFYTQRPICRKIAQGISLHMPLLHKQNNNK